MASSGKYVFRRPPPIKRLSARQKLGTMTAPAAAPAADRRRALATVTEEG